MSHTRLDQWELPDRYTLEKFLGKGSYGQVAQGFDRKLNKIVAIKYMEDIFHQATDAKRAYREIHILRHLQHPNIVGLLDVVAPSLNTADQDALMRRRRMRDLGDLYLVFEFVDTDLSKIFKSEQFMLAGHVQFILYQLLLGLKFMHSASVIHRDIKPANILISCTDCAVKIADFGLARVVGPEELYGGGRPDVVTFSPTTDPLPTSPLPEKRSSSSQVAPPTPPPTTAHSSSSSQSSSSVARNVPGSGAGIKSSYFAPSVTSGHPLTRMAGVGERDRSLYDDVSHLQPILNTKRSEQNVFQSGGALGPLDELGPPMDGEFGAMAPMLRRQLTHHVVTRWYRAPEVILSQPYTAAVDVWSVGCIFAELLVMIKENVSHFKQRRPIFPGESCGELSAHGKEDVDKSFHDGGRDQLNIIFDVIGTPSEEELSYVTPSVAHEIRAFRKRPPLELGRKFPACDRNAISLLNSMLTFDPNVRISVDDALRHPYLAPFHSEEKLRNAVCLTPMSVDVETIGEDPEHLFDNIVREIQTYKKRTEGVSSPMLVTTV